MNNNHFSCLSAKHDQWLLFTSRIRKGLGNGADLNTIREYAVYYWQYYIKPHFYHEETLIIPYTNNCYLAGQFQKEHEDINELLFSLNRHSHKTLFTILVSFMENLVKFERHILIKHLDKVLTEDQKIEINTKLEHNLLVFKEWKKEFWHTKAK